MPFESTEKSGRETLNMSSAHAIVVGDKVAFKAKGRNETTDTENTK